MTTPNRPAIIVHGGAGRILDEELPQRLEGCKDAALAGWKILKQGGSALDAAEAAVVVLEDNPLFNAGTGSTLNSLGKVEMDAVIMEGSTLSAGAVAVVQRIKNPIKLARRVMEDGRHVLLACEGAQSFARQIGFPECAPELLIVETERKRWEEKHGTVGCVVLDGAGRIAVASRSKPSYCFARKKDRQHRGVNRHRPPGEDCPCAQHAQNAGVLGDRQQWRRDRQLSCRLLKKTHRLRCTRPISRQRTEEYASAHRSSRASPLRSF